MSKVPPGAGAPVSRLKPRLLSNMQGSFLPARWEGHNASGHAPIGRNILVRMDQMSNITAGGVMLPDEQIDKQNEASESGCIFAVGPGAFLRFRDGTPWDGPPLVVGDRIYIDKYAGIKCLGRDGLVYRLIECDVIGSRMDFGYADDETFEEGAAA